MKMITPAYPFKSTPKAIQDFEDAMKILGKLHDEGTMMEYKDNVEKTVVKRAFSRFNPRYKAVKETAGECGERVFD